MNDPEQYRDRFTKIMRNYIRAVVTRYRGKFVDWVLLNEILDDAGKLDQNNFWVRIVGPDIARIAIQEARSADPGISIIINDYVLMWNDPKTNGMVSFLEGLKQEGLLTSRDAVGIQAHDSFLNPKWRNLEQAKREFKDTLRKFGQIGIHARITELDLFDVFNDDLTTKLKKASIYRTTIFALYQSEVAGMAISVDNTCMTSHYPGGGPCPSPLCAFPSRCANSWSCSAPASAAVNGSTS